MADGSGVAAGAESAAGSGTAGTGEAAGGAAAESAAATLTTTGAAPGGAETQPWFAGLDKDTSGWLQNKGYFGPDFSKADLAKGIAHWVKSDRGLESIIGKNRLPMPSGPADTETYDAVYKALGRPADPAGYGIKLPEGGSKDYFDGMMGAFHKAGLSDAQAQAVAAASNELGAKVLAAREAETQAAFEIKSGSDLEAQRAEWRGDADRNFAAGQRAAQQFGVGKEMMLQMEKAIGTKPLLQLFAKIGQGLTEDRSSGHGNAADPGVLSPEAANAKLADLKKDGEWLKKYQAGEAGAVAEFRKLTNALAGA